VHLSQPPYSSIIKDVYRMIRRRAEDAEVHTKIGCHNFRATGITKIYGTAENSKWLSRWPVTSLPGPRASMTGVTIKCHLMKSSAF